MLVCLPLALWAVKTGHRWIPLLLFAAYLIAVQLISRKLPQAPSVPIEPQQLLRTLASGFAFIGFIIAAACLAAALSMPFGGFKGLPGWAVVLILVWWSLSFGFFVGSKVASGEGEAHAVIKLNHHAHD